MEGIGSAAILAIAVIWLAFALATKPACQAEQTAIYHYVGWYCATRQ